MTNKNRLTGFVLPFLILVSFALNAETETTSKLVKTNTASDSNKNSVIVETKANKRKTGKFSYVPPKRGAPAVRIGGGSRGIGKQILELVVFAPDHTGLTTKEQPTLYWYTSEAVLSKLELTIIKNEKSNPEFEQIIAITGSAGIQSFDLAKTKIRLEKGIEYRWFVSVVAGENQRSNDIVASGTIKRIVPGAKLNSALSAANEFSRIDTYAQYGIWYDAIDSLMKMTTKSPKDSDLLDMRITLLQQVGLQSAADYVRKNSQ